MASAASQPLAFASFLRRAAMARPPGLPAPTRPVERLAMDVSLREHPCAVNPHGFTRNGRTLPPMQRAGSGHSLFAGHPAVDVSLREHPRAVNPLGSQALHRDRRGAHQLSWRCRLPNPYRPRRARRKRPLATVSTVNSSCPRRAYPTANDAAHALANVRAARGGYSRSESDEKSFYRCGKCGHWHLTSRQSNSFK